MPRPSQMELGGSESSLTSPLGSLQSSPLGSSPLPPLTSSSHPNGTEQAVFPSTVPHSWLCDGTLLCLHDPVREDNMAAFQHQWRRGAVRDGATSHETTSLPLPLPPLPSLPPSVASVSSWCRQTVDLRDVDATVLWSRF